MDNFYFSFSVGETESESLSDSFSDSVPDSVLDSVSDSFSESVPEIYDDSFVVSVSTEVLFESFCKLPIFVIVNLRFSIIILLKLIFLIDKISNGFIKIISCISIVFVPMLMVDLVCSIKLSFKYIPIKG